MKHSNKILLFSAVASMAILLGAVVFNDHSSGKNVYSITENDKFSFSKEKNVFLFILDGFQSDLFWQFIDQEPQLREHLTGFKFYPNTTSVFAKTYPTVPMLLTGQVYQKKQSIHEFLDIVYENSLLTDLIDSGWNVGLYPNHKNLLPVSDSIMSNVINNIGSLEKIENYLQALDLSLFRSMPHAIKKLIVKDGAFLVKNSTFEYFEELPVFAPEVISPKKLPKVDKHQGINFFANLKSHANIESTDPVFRYYHLLMPHSPFNLDRNLNHIPNSFGFKSYQDYAYASLKLMISYLKELKELNIYNQSAIIITADHGGGEYTKNKYDHATTSFTKINQFGKEKASGKPLLLVKGFNQNNVLEHAQKPVSLLDIMPTLSDFADIKPRQSKGMVIDYIDDDLYRERPYYHYNFTGFDSKYLQDFSVFKIIGHAYDDDSWVQIGVLKPNEKATLNTGLYELSKTLTFGTDIKVDADYNNQFYDEGHHEILDSSIQSNNQHFRLPIPLDQPLIHNQSYQLELELSAQIPNSKITIEINHKKLPMIQVKNKMAAYKVPFIANFPDPNLLNINIQAFQQQSSNKLFLSKLKISPFNLSGLESLADGYFLDFSKNINKFNPKGFWPERHWGSWTAKKQASIMFSVPKDFCQSNSIRLNVEKFYTTIDPQEFRIFMNDKPLTLTPGIEKPKGIQYQLNCPVLTNEEINIIELKFQTKTTVSPASINASPDKRRLGVGIHSLEVEKL